jgi:transporter family-2 protein
LDEFLTESCKVLIEKEKQEIMSLIALVVLAVLAGFCLPTQAGINAQLNLWCRSSILAATISFAVGTLALLIYALILRIPWPPAGTVSRYPWWIWSGGLLGAFLVVSTILLAPRLGAASMVSLVVAGQMLASVFLDQFGLLGYEVHPFNAWRLIGVMMLVGGVVMIKSF